MTDLWPIIESLEDVRRTLSIDVLPRLDCKTDESCLVRTATKFLGEVQSSLTREYEEQEYEEQEKERQRRASIQVSARICPQCERDCGIPDFEDEDRSVGIFGAFWSSTCEACGIIFTTDAETGEQKIEEDV